MRATLILWVAALLSGASAFPTLLPRQATSSPISLRFGKKSKSHKVDDDQGVFSSPLTNAGGEYYIDVEIGTPAQPLSLLLDTGSSDIWAYAPEAESSCPGCTTEYYDPSKSSTVVPRDDLGPFEISYGTANSGVTGVNVSDTLSVNGIAATITVGVVTEANAGDPPGGIMGIGLPGDEASVEQSGQQYPGFITSLLNQGIIAVPAFSVYLDPNTFDQASGGTIIFGGYDPSKYGGKLVPFPFVEPSPPPDSAYRLDVDAPTIQFSVNGDKYTVPSSPDYYTVLLDTGTGVSRLPKSQVEAIAKVLGATPIPNDPVGAYAVSCDYASASGGWSFTFSGTSGDLTINVPWTEMALPDGNGGCDLGFVPQPEGEGNYAFGDNFLRSAYLLYNYPKGSVSMGQASLDDSCTDCVQPLT